MDSSPTAQDCAHFQYLTTQDDATIAAALHILQRRMTRHWDELSSPQMVKDYLRLKFCGLEHEVFVVLFLDIQNRLIADEEMFRGTLTQTSVYPREIVKAALQRNAAGVIFSHNHPSGVAEPSRADEMLTANLKRALMLIDVRVIDHIVVGATTTVSFAERSLI